MNHIEGNFIGARGIRVHYQAWLPEAEAKAGLVLVHGLGSHSGRYMNVVDRLVAHGIAVHGFDHIGHGKSDGPRGRIERFADFTDTLAVYCGRAKGWQAGKPFFLFGHSMGGLIATRYLLDHPMDFKGAILSAPALKPGEGISPAMILAGRVLSAVAPGMGLFRLPAAGLSRDPQVVKAYRNDPLVHHGKTPARLAVELLKAMRRVEREAGGITLPLLILLGGADKIVNPGGSRMLYEKAGSKDKTIRIYEDLYHETFNEPERELVLDDVEAWLAARV
jgi:alpha-beta hydrolase superfamily lysophospholipase